MSSKQDDKRLGLDRPITRRDFLNGIALSVGATVVSADTVLAAALTREAALEKDLSYYPPAKKGLRGNHDGTFTYAHQLRDGQKWNANAGAASTGETYDLAIVGGGISGLAAAYFFRKAA